MSTHEAHLTSSKINSGEWSLCPMPSSLLSCPAPSSDGVSGSLSPQLLFWCHIHRGESWTGATLGCVGSARPGASPPGSVKLSAQRKKELQQCLPLSGGLTAQDLQTTSYSIRALFLLYSQSFFKIAIILKYQHISLLF
jgi:hypothetical protein